MKKIKFLMKLNKENKLEVIEPSEEIKQSYIEKSESNLESSKILLNNNKLEESIILTYYSLYNLLTALLFKTGIKCENHSASIILMKELFNLNNSEISNAKSERIDKQYYTDFEVTKQEVIEAIQNAEEFNNNLFDFISKLNNEDINTYRKSFKTLINLK